MKRQDILSILITFVVGFFAGGYLYVAHFAKVFNPDPVATEEVLDDFSVIGEAYGGCRDRCPSFQLLSDGSYRYQRLPEIGTEKIITPGTLPLDIQRDLKNSLNEDVLREQSQVIEPSACASFSDGIDLRYRITFEGEDYIVDSCGTTLDAKGELATGLAKIWNYLQTVR